MIKGQVWVFLGLKAKEIGIVLLWIICIILGVIILDLTFLSVVWGIAALYQYNHVIIYTILFGVISLILVCPIRGWLKSNWKKAGKIAKKRLKGE